MKTLAVVVAVVAVATAAITEANVSSQDQAHVRSSNTADINSNGNLA